MPDLVVRPVRPADADAVWDMLQPVFAAGDTYVVDSDIDRSEALEYWTKGKDTFVVQRDDGSLVGTYYLVRNQKGGGSHVCNCGFITAQSARGLGVARQMLEHALDTARDSGYRAMQFNFVVATNTRAVETWKKYGFDVVGRLPEAFEHPSEGFVDALIMFRML